jgi:hypothetical protein
LFEGRLRAVLNMAVAAKVKKYERTYFLYFSILERQRFRSCRRIGCVAKPLCDRWRQWALRVGSGLFAFGGIADMNS